MVMLWAVLAPQVSPDGSPYDYMLFFLISFGGKVKPLQLYPGLLYV